MALYESRLTIDEARRLLLVCSRNSRERLDAIYGDDAIIKDWAACHGYIISDPYSIENGVPRDAQLAGSASRLKRILGLVVGTLTVNLYGWHTVQIGPRVRLRQRNDDQILGQPVTKLAVVIQVSGPIPVQLDAIRVR